ncbi:MAG: L-rhamnose mutarotase [Sedimentisphaerales bacterium]|nr:L-rhamnose mutarotase [Sedimentisphaerales bacterium]
MKKLMRVFISAVIGLAGFGCAAQNVQRYGMVLGLKEEKIPEYTKIHADVWPGVLKLIKDCNIRNYSIYLHRLDDGRHYLFAYFEYTGKDFKADMDKMAEDETMKKWWEICEPMQIPVKNRQEGEWWAEMKEVFHTN